MRSKQHPAVRSQNSIGVASARFLLLLLAMSWLAGCATPPNPKSVKVPDPIRGNTGKYLCPYLLEGGEAPWVSKSLNASIGAAIGGTVGAYAGSKLLEQVPYIGGIIGAKVGDEVGRRLAIEAAGGEAYMRETSDLSFDSIDDLIVWCFAVHSGEDNYEKIMKKTAQIYPEIPKRAPAAIAKAAKEGNARG